LDFVANVECRRRRRIERCGRRLVALSNSSDLRRTLEICVSGRANPRVIFPDVRTLGSAGDHSCNLASDTSRPTLAHHNSPRKYLCLRRILYLVYGDSWDVGKRIAGCMTKNEDEVGQRRRGLNIVTPVTPPSEGLGTEKQISVPATGLYRFWYLLRELYRSRKLPERLQLVLEIDTVNQVVGRCALYNRRVLELTRLGMCATPGLVERGARVTRVVIDATEETSNSAPVFHDEVSFSPDVFSRWEERFDVIVANNAFGAFASPASAVDALVKCVAVGGSIIFYSKTGRLHRKPTTLPTDLNGPKNAVDRHITLRNLRAAVTRSDLAIVSFGPRYLPTYLASIASIPILKNILTRHVFIVVERTRY